MSVHALRAVSIGLVPSLLSVACAADVLTGAKTVKLSANAVPVPGAVMTPTVITGANQNGFRMMMVSKAGVLLPMQRATFAKDQGEQTVTVGGVNLTFVLNRDSRVFALKPEKGAAVPLKQQDDGLAATVVPLADKKKLPLAFPYAYVGRTESMFTMRAASTLKGTLDGEMINFLDDDLDGKIDKTDVFTLGQNFCYAAIPAKIATKKGVFAVGEIAEKGDQATFTPEETATVPLTFVYTGVSAGHAAIASQDGSIVTLVTGTKDVVKLPPGAYKLLHGVVVDGKGKVMAAMLPGQFPAYTLASDADPKQKPVFAYGGPYKLGFKARVANGKITVTPDITLSGANGEEYVDFRWQGTPTVYVNGKQNGSMGFG